MLVIYTIGHSNVDAKKMIALLKAHGIELVLDVRSSPYSRFSPQFNRETLAGTLSEEGIQYEYAGRRLGGRPSDAGCYDGHRVLYGEVASREWYREAIDRLLELAGEQRTAVMCAEEDPRGCHRHLLIAQTLVARGVKVAHIRGDGSLEEARREPEQLHLFRRGKMSGSE